MLLLPADSRLYTACSNDMRSTQLSRRSCIQAIASASCSHDVQEAYINDITGEHAYLHEAYSLDKSSVRDIHWWLYLLTQVGSQVCQQLPNFYRNLHLAQGFLPALFLHVIGVGVQRPMPTERCGKYK